mmetsp:Transcript_13545/g.21130  ORF Transcript_13545/g.21130 Transcript_13545/m.21130 type:complete len:179 (+) Transcript_13545:158-694(+)
MGESTAVSHNQRRIESTMRKRKVNLPEFGQEQQQKTLIKSIMYNPASFLSELKNLQYHQNQIPSNRFKSSYFQSDMRSVKQRGATRETVRNQLPKVSHRPSLTNTVDKRKTFVSPSKEDFYSISNRKRKMLRDEYTKTSSLFANDEIGSMSRKHRGLTQNVSKRQSVSGSPDKHMATD